MRTGNRHRLFGAALCAVAVLLFTMLASSLLPSTHAATADSPPFDHPDRACRTCHQTIYDNFQRTAMARGSGPATDQADVALLGERGFHHQPSDITYRILLRDGQAILTFNREKTSEHPSLAGERRLDYFIGSGKRGRTYLYQAAGLWFESPINWYGKKEVWDMAPAFEQVSSMPAPLPTDSNCLHCHAGEVQPATGPVRNHFDGPPFRQAGIGCAACHGDPAAHLASAGKAPLSILNPDRLAPAKRDSICLQCHLEGDATVSLPGKSLSSFVPGQDLADSAIYFVDRSRAQFGSRASSQYEALLRSACKRAAGDALTCTTCHDPHSSPAPAERVAFFRARCLQCHNAPAFAATHHPEQRDCALCHMPTRKTLDISHEQLTDHDIEARPADHAKRIDRVGAPDLVAVGTASPGPREVGLAYAQIAQHGNRQAGERALALLQKAERTGSDDVELHNQLGYLFQVSGAIADARAEYTQALRQEPGNITAAANLAVLDAAGGRTNDALRLLQQTIHEDPTQTVAGLNLAYLQCRLGDKAAALRTVQQMLLFNPDSSAARVFLEDGIYGGSFCSLR